MLPARAKAPTTNRKLFRLARAGKIFARQYRFE